MYIEKIKLKNYRNYDELELNLTNGVNIIYGENAVGKTNFLEAIYISSIGKSHKFSKDKDIIKFDREEAHIKEQVFIKNREYIIDIHLKKNQNKGIAVNGKKINKISDFLGLINVVFFSPEDLDIIKEGPIARRKFLDFYICQIDKIYTFNLSCYNKILNNRNKILKTIKFTNNQSLLETIDIYDEELVKYGIEIIKKRKEVIKELEKKIYDIHFFISGEKEKIKTLYEQNIEEENFLKDLKNNREKEIKYQTTTIGPQRDDIKFMIEDVDIRRFGSQGQQRTAALSLKLAELESIKEKKDDAPILLLDDVFSELDENRQKLLVKNLKNIQTIITCTGLSEDILKILAPDKIYLCKDNNIKSM